MITLYVNILAERIVLANSNLLLEKSCHNKKLDSVRSAGLSLENLSSYLLKPLLKKLVLVDSVVVGKVVSQGEGKDERDDYSHQNKNSRHCHAQKQSFLINKKD